MALVTYKTSYNGHKASVVPHDKAVAIKAALNDTNVLQGLSEAQRAYIALVQNVYVPDATDYAANWKEPVQGEIPLKTDTQIEMERYK